MGDSGLLGPSSKRGSSGPSRPLKPELRRSLGLLTSPVDHPCGGGVIGVYEGLGHIVVVAAFLHGNHVVSLTVRVEHVCETESQCVTDASARGTSFDWIQGVFSLTLPLSLAKDGVGKQLRHPICFGIKTVVEVDNDGVGF